MNLLPLSYYKACYCQLSNGLYDEPPIVALVHVTSKHQWWNVKRVEDGAASIEHEADFVPLWVQRGDIFYDMTDGTHWKVRRVFLDDGKYWVRLEHYWDEGKNTDVLLSELADREDLMLMGK